VLLCMQAHEDQLSRRCQFALYRASRQLERSINRVERVAEACWNDIEAQCGDTDRIGQCLVQKSGTLSQPCQAVLTGLRQAVQGLATLRGMPVYSADDKNVGQIVEATRGPDGKVQSVQVAVGRWLGIGDRVVTISADDFERLADRVRLRLAGEEVRALPEAKAK
jgi:PRC-barrel domain